MMFTFNVQAHTQVCVQILEVSAFKCCSQFSSHLSDVVYSDLSILIQKCQKKCIGPGCPSFSAVVFKLNRSKERIWFQVLGKRKTSGKHKENDSSTYWGKKAATDSFLTSFQRTTLSFRSYAVTRQHGLLVLLHFSIF